MKNVNVRKVCIRCKFYVHDTLKPRSLATVTDSVPKMTGPYRELGECRLQRHTLCPQNDPFHLVGSPILKDIFRGMWTYSTEQTLKNFFLFVHLWIITIEHERQTLTTDGSRGYDCRIRLQI